MFERFLEVYRPIEGEPLAPDSRHRSPFGSVRGFEELMTAFSGKGFNLGVYRLHAESTGRAADRLVGQNFPWLQNRAYCFGYTWNGMQVALDDGRKHKNGEPLILLLDLADQSAFDIDVCFEPFHNIELVDNPDDSLDSELFDAWAWENQLALPLKRGCIVGYKIPLSLGGPDSVENMTVIDMEVEWELDTQIRKQIGDFPPGTQINGMKIE